MVPSIIYLSFALLANAGAQLLYKGYALYRKRVLLGTALVAFILVPYFNYEALKGLSLDVVYMATSLTIVLVMGGSVFFFRESLKPYHVLGGSLILAGIVIYNL